MVAIHEQVNEKSSYLRTFSDRLAEERKRLGFSQADFGRLVGVGRTTQLKYESGEGEPGVYYMARVEAMDVDVMYLVTGVRSTEGLSDELQNLVSAYLDADEPTQQAVFGVLVARLSDDVRRARKTPGWYRHELAGEDDARYPAAASAPHLLHDTPAPLQVPGDMDNLTPPAGTEPARRG